MARSGDAMTRFAASTWIAVLCFLVLAGVNAPGQASAQTVAPHLDPAKVSEFARIIKANWTAGEVAQLQAEASLSSSTASSVGRSIGGSLNNVRTAVGMYGSGALSNGGGLLTKIGTIGAGVTAFSVGWNIGGWINRHIIYTDSDNPDQPTVGTPFANCSTGADVKGVFSGGFTVGAHVLPAGVYFTCGGSTSSTNYIRYTPDAHLWGNSVPVEQWGIAFASEIGVGTHCSDVPGWVPVCYLYQTRGDFFARWTSISALQDGTYSGGLAVNPTSQPSDQSLVDAARAEALNNPEFGAWIDYQLDPVNYPDPTQYVLPQIQTGETADAYRTRLQSLGQLGTITIEPATEPDYRFPPGAALGALPAPGSSVAPGTDVVVYENPSNVPDPDAPIPDAGGCTPWVKPDIDTDPLFVSNPLDKFPFGIFTWAYTGLAQFVDSPEAPSFSWSFPGYDGTLTIDLAVVQPMVDILRPVMVFLFGFGVIWFFGRAFLGMSGGKGDT